MGHGNDKIKKLEFKNTIQAGQERFQSLGVAFYRGSDCCTQKLALFDTKIYQGALVFDVNDEKSFINVQTWKEEFLLKAGIEEPEKFPFVLIGNKIDVQDKREVAKKRALKWCEDNNMPYFETSAKEGTGVIDSFSSLAKDVLFREKDRKIN